MNGLYVLILTVISGSLDGGAAVTTIPNLSHDECVAAKHDWLESLNQSFHQFGYAVCVQGDALGRLR